MTQSQNTSTSPSAGIGAIACPLGNLPLAALSYRTRIVGLAVETEVSQTFTNPHANVIEATYVFPLPENGAVTRCRMKIGDRVIEAKLRERQQAREEYQQALEQGYRAALLEEDRSETFSLQVGNLAPDDIIEVLLVMVTPLEIVAGEATLRLPLVVAPKYVPGIPLDGHSVGNGTAVDTDQVPDASRVAPPVLLEGLPSPVRLAIQVDLDRDLIAGIAQDDDWFKQLDSPLFPISISQFDKCSIKLDPLQCANRDFLLRFPVVSDEVRTAVQVQSIAMDAKLSDTSVVALTIVPPNESGDTKQSRDIFFVLDRSGSMGGWKIDAAVRATVRLIESLGPEDRFQAIAFDTIVERPSTLPESWITATDENRWQAVRWLATIGARGGTEMGPALMAALRQFESRTESEADNQSMRSKSIVLVTDGHVAGEDSIHAALAKFAPQSRPRMFVIGVDRCVNMGIMKKLASAAGGVAELVESKERFNQVFERLAGEIGNPWLCDIKMELQTSGGNIDLLDDAFPRNNNALFHGRPQTIYAACPLPDDSSSGLTVRVRGRLGNGEDWESRVPAVRIEEGPVVSMWGRHSVRELEDEYVMTGSSDHALQQKIIATSLLANVLCRFTAYIAVDSAETVSGHEMREQIAQPVEIPAGWESQEFTSLTRSSALSDEKFSSSRFLIPPNAPSENEGEVFDGLEVSCFSSACYESADSIAQEFPLAAIDSTETEDLGDEGDDSGASPVVRLVMEMLNESVRQKASYILLVPREDSLDIYYVIDGKLQKRDTLGRQLAVATISRLKLLAKIDLDASDVPQKGQFDIQHGETNVVFEVSTVPFNKRQAVLLRNDALSSSALQGKVAGAFDEIQRLLNQLQKIEQELQESTSSRQIE